jgi:hypothetical protein
MAYFGSRDQEPVALSAARPPRLALPDSAARGADDIVGILGGPNKMEADRCSLLRVARCWCSLDGYHATLVSHLLSLTWGIGHLTAPVAHLHSPKT